MPGNTRSGGSSSERFAALFETYYPQILGYARRRASAEDAADVAAETFSVAWRRFEDVPDGHAALLWLYGAARRVLWNIRRSEARRERLGYRVRSEGGDGAVDAFEQIHGTDAQPHVAAAFCRLRTDDRELLGLMAWEQLTSTEIAATLGCSRNAARIRIHRARRRFLHELAALDGQAECSETVGARISKSARADGLGLEGNAWKTT
jgi:RNA polymerase sigma-70 factor (ECF subfamily)